jgi:hypothetical protein
MGKYKSLIISPYFVHLFYKKVWIISFDHIFDSWWDIDSNELTNIESNFLIDVCFFLWCWFRCGGYIKVINGSKLRGRCTILDVCD